MAKIEHSCGHSIEYKAVKDRKAVAARACPACEYAAQQVAKATPKAVYCVSKGYESTAAIITIEDGADGIGSLVREFSSDRLPAGYATFATRSAAEDHVRSLVQSGNITFIVPDARERAATRCTSAMAEADTIDVPPTIEPTPRPEPSPEERRREAIRATVDYQVSKAFDPEHDAEYGF